MVEQPPEGPAWGQLASRPGLAAVLDPADAHGVKNRLIDRAHKESLRRALGSVYEARALDFGCGNGRLSRWLAERGADVVGIDATPEMIESARRAAPHLVFELFDGVNVPVEDASVDVVVSAYVLQYYVSDVGGYGRLLRELGRILVPGGRLAMIEQVTSGSGSGPRPRTQYLRGLEEAGFALELCRPVRAGDSHVIRLVQSWPLLERLPRLDAALTAEARFAAARGPRADAYVDYLFVARV